MNTTQEKLLEYLPHLQKLEIELNALSERASSDEEQLLAQEAWERVTSLNAFIEIKTNR